MEIQQLEFLKHLLRFKRHVYLDHNATTNVSRHVRRKMNHVLKYCYGNPSALYGIGRKSAAIMEEARQHVADAIHADPGEIYFTGCATESNNAVLKSVSNYFYPKKKKIISIADRTSLGDQHAGVFANAGDRCRILSCGSSRPRASGRIGEADRRGDLFDLLHAGQ